MYPKILKITSIRTKYQQSTSGCSDRMVKLLKQSSQVVRAIFMLFDDFVPLITSQILGCEVSQVLHTNIERNKWLSLLL